MVHRLIPVLALLVAASFTGCAGNRVAEGKIVNDSGRFRIPFVVPLQHATPPRATIVEFENPASADGSHRRPVIVGIRFVIYTGIQPDEAAARLRRHQAEEDALRALPLGATVRMWRTTGGATAELPLTRLRFDPASRENVRERATHGRVHSMFPNTTDRLASMHAGLWPAGEGWFADEYSMARSPALEAGTYRVEVHFDRTLQFPPDRMPELQVAHDMPAQ